MFVYKTLRQTALLSELQYFNFHVVPERISDLSPDHRRGREDVPELKRFPPG